MTTDLAEPIKKLIDAVNDSDTERFVGAFGADGVVNDWGREFQGPEEIRGWSDNELIGKNSTLTVTDVRTVGEDTVVIANVGGDGFNGPSTFTFTTAAGHIAKMAITE